MQTASIGSRGYILCDNKLPLVLPVNHLLVMQLKKLSYHWQQLEASWAVWHGTLAWWWWWRKAHNLQCLVKCSSRAGGPGRFPPQSAERTWSCGCKRPQGYTSTCRTDRGTRSGIQYPWWKDWMRMRRKEGSKSEENKTMSVCKHNNSFSPFLFYSKHLLCEIYLFSTENTHWHTGCKTLNRKFLASETAACLKK